MKKQTQISDLTRLLRFQQSILNLAAKCSLPQPARKRAAAAPTRLLEQLAKRIEARAG
ncbi:MAG: hypothetical protein ACUVS7_16155 [Bryobacteraceae bacterium]